MRALPVLILAVAGSLTFAGGAQAYRLCNDPDRVYRVVSVERVSCSYAKHFAEEYNRRLNEAYSDGDDAPAQTRMWGWRLVVSRSGVYFGLAGARTVWRRDNAKIRIDSRGE